MNRKSIKWIILLLIVLAVGALLAYSINQNISSVAEFFSNGVLRSETVMIVTFLLLGVPLLLVILLLIMAFVRPKSQTITATLNGTVKASAPQDSADAESRERDGASRFCMLNEIENQKSEYKRFKYDKNITLMQLCEDFRNYAASRLKLYYDISDIRRFIAGMAVSHIIILQGMSGTGKTSLAQAFGSYIDNTSTIIPVQPMWKERTDLIGYYNEFTKKFNETLLLEKMYEANYSDNIYITVLDEMNIARIEYYFAEFLSLLELPNPDERYIDVVSDKWESDPKQLVNGRIKLPENMWFIGTANNDDSTFAISDKVYDRAMILNLDTKSERYVAPKTGKLHISYEQFTALVDEAIVEYEISARNKKRLEELDAYLVEHFHITFGNRIMKQIRTYIPVYISCGGDELDALDDILAKKVIRKLETQNPIYLRNASDGLISFINELFGPDKMTICKEHIHRLERNA